MGFRELIQSKRVVVLLIATMAIALGAGIAVASHGGGGHVYYACLTNGGTLNNVSVDTASACARGSVPISWNQEGQQGRPGPDKALVTQEVIGRSSFNSLDAKTVVVFCPAGTKLVGGGGLINGPPDVALKATWPNHASNGWQAAAHETSPTSEDWGVNAYAICASLS